LKKLISFKRRLSLLIKKQSKHQFQTFEVSNWSNWVRHSRWIQISKVERRQQAEAKLCST
jgi:hypothetical protein